MRAPLLMLLIPALLAGGCQYFRGEPGLAGAEIQPTRGHAAAGRVEFLRVGPRVRVTATVTGLAPHTQHGFHVHEVGDCSAPDASSAGGHFNPFGKAHAHYTARERHAGDLPALQADARGTAEIEADVDIVSVTGGPADIAGRSVVVHANADNFRTQPAGNSGARIACGVIRRMPH